MGTSRVHSPLSIAPEFDRRSLMRSSRVRSPVHILSPGSGVRVLPDQIEAARAGHLREREVAAVLSVARACAARDRDRRRLLAGKGEEGKRGSALVPAETLFIRDRRPYSSGWLGRPWAAYVAEKDVLGVRRHTIELANHKDVHVAVV